MPPATGRRLWPLWLAGAGAAAWQLAVAVASLVHALQGGWAVDYLAFQAGARLAGSDPGSMYSRPAQAAVENGLLGYTTPLSPHFPQLFINPPVAAELLRPLAALSLQASTDYFVLICVMALALAGLLGARLLPPMPRWQRALVVLLVAASGPAGYSLLLGQWAPLLLLCAVGGALLIRERPLLAGLLLSLLAVKPQTVWLVPLVLVLAGVWRPLIGVVAGGVVMACVSLVAVGPAGLRAYYGLVTGPYVSKANSLGVPHSLSVITGSVIPTGIITLVLVMVAAAATWRVRRCLCDDVQLALAWGLTLSLALSPYVNEQDFLVLGVAVWVWMGRQPIAAAVALVVAGLALFVWPFNWTTWLPGCAAVAVIAVLIAEGAGLLAATRRLSARSGALAAPLL